MGRPAAVTSPPAGATRGVRRGLVASLFTLPQRWMALQANDEAA
jgi:hypothetical protein